MTPDSSNIDKEGSNENFFGLDTMDELDFFDEYERLMNMKLMNMKDQHVKVSLEKSLSSKIPSI